MLTTDAYTNVGDSMYMMKIDSEGEIVAQIHFPFANYEWIEDIWEDLEGNIILLTADDLPPE